MWWLRPSSAEKNPALKNDFLTALMANTGVWASVPEPVRLNAIFAFADNPRLTAEYCGNEYDGLAEFDFYRVSSAVWDLAQNAPVTTPWAYRIAKLYDKLPPSGIKQPFKVASRWFPDPNDAEAMKLEKLNDFGDLECYQTIRMHLARCVLATHRSDDKLRNQLIGHQDIAFRCAAYRVARFTTDEINAAFERDKIYAVRYLMQNEGLWQHEETRDQLHSLVSNIKDEGGFVRRNYSSAQIEFQKKHPRWFAELRNPDIVDGDEAAAKSDVGTAVRLVSGRIDELQNLHHSRYEMLERKIRRLGGIIIVLFIVGILFALLFR